MNLTRFLFRWLLGKRLPTVEGDCAVVGLHAPVTIHRDTWGIPHIEAQNDHDAWFALGFCHGQDRAFQLELLLRIQRGTLAALVGPAGVPLDRLSRRIGFHHASGLQLPYLAADIRSTLDAYCEGIHCGSTLGVRKQAHEFTLLRSVPSLWQAADVLGILKLQSFLLAANWDVELARLRILLSDGPEALAALNPHSPEWLLVTDPPGNKVGKGLDHLAEELAAFTQFTGVGGGSNNWALKASRTATGRPLLANDPHLFAMLPSNWYLAHLKTSEWAIAGATYVGIPAVTVGHNGYAAWGVTAGLVDNTDLFRERLGPDGKSVYRGDRLVACEVRSEEIVVRKREPIREDVLITSHGPIIGRALEEEGEALSLRATWLDPEPVEGLFRLARVRSFDAFREAFRAWPLGSMNMVYADITNEVGWQLVGKAPRRKKGFGLLPQAGWDREAGWENEPIPFDMMPSSRCKEADFVATANTAPAPEGVGPFLGTDWIEGYRQTAIVEAIEARSGWDVASTMALQTDRRTLVWRDVREAVRGIDFASLPAACALLREWDGVVSPDSSAATLYELFMAEMANRVAQCKAPRSFEWALGKGVLPLTPINFFAYRRAGHLVRLLREQPSGWFPRPWRDEMAEALRLVHDRLVAKYGRDSSLWAWGKLRTLTMKHLLGRKRLLAPLFNLGPIALGGDTDTIAQASVLPLEPLAGAVNIPSLRVVIDVGAWNNSRFVLPGGQSGNPLSPHYGGQFPLWQRGEGVPIPWTSEEVKASTRYTLSLRPTGLVK